MARIRQASLAALVGVICLGWAALAVAEGQQIGKVTHQALPRWVSMKAEQANARRGPSMHHRVDWVFKHRHMPLLVTAEHGHWRRVQDRDGVGGWVHYVMLSRARTAIIEAEDVMVRRQPVQDAPVVAEAQYGAIVHLKDCDGTWCRIISGRLRGWVPQHALWGTQMP